MGRFPWTVPPTIISTIMIPLVLVLMLVVLMARCSAEHVWRDGYWWSAGVAHERYRCHIERRVNTGSCWRTIRVLSWCYRPVQVQVDGSEGPIPYSPNWRTKLLEIAQAREEYTAFSASVREMGLAAAVPPSAVQGGPNAAYGQIQYVPNAQQPNVAYGYGGLNSVGRLFDNQSLALAVNALARGQDRSYDVTEKINAGLANLSRSLGNNQVRVAQVLAANLREESEAEEGPSSDSSDAVAATSGDHTAPLAAIITKHCLSCHGEAKKSKPTDIFPAGLDLRQILGFNPVQRQRVVDQILSGEMPHEREALPLESVRPFFQWLEARR